MRKWTAILALKITAAVMLAQILAFAVGVVPQHLAALEHPHHCGICALIHHPPAAQCAAVASPDPSLPSGLHNSIRHPFAIASPAMEDVASRAPPQSL